MAEGQKVYMPLVIGDWLKGTRGMRAEVRGVYLNLLLYQWDNGFIPSDMDELCLIDPELPKVWVKLKDKFVEIEPGKLQNKKNEEVREFWAKQKKNGKKGGRPKVNNPEANPNNNPKHNHHNDIDLDNDIVVEYQEGVQGEKVHTMQVSLPEKELETDDTLADVTTWTEQVIQGNDVVFIESVRKRSIVLNGALEKLARDHLDLCSRYNWHKHMESQQAFRNSLLKHVTENINKHEQQSNKGISRHSSAQVSGTDYSGGLKKTTG